MKLSIFKDFWKFFKLHFLYLKVSLKYHAVYKVSTFLTVIFSLIFLIAEILTVDVYYEFTDQIGGWDVYSFYILLGSFNIMACLYTYFFEISHDTFSYKIRFGELDSDLIRPFDAQAFLALDKVDYASLFNLPIPIWLIYRGIEGLGLNLGAPDVMLYFIILLLGVFIFYLVNQFSVNLSFWFTETNNLVAASDQIVQLGSKPLQVYPKLIQLGFSFIIPIILCTNLSVSALKHELTMLNFLILFCATGLFYTIVRIQWRLGLRRYSSASS